MPRHPFRAAVEQADMDAAVELLAEDVVFRSPAVFKPYEGREAVATILRTVFGVSRTSATRTSSTATASTACCSTHGSGPLAAGHRSPATRRPGQIAEFTVMFRPASGLIALAERMGPALQAAGVR